MSSADSAEVKENDEMVPSRSQVSASRGYRSLAFTPSLVNREKYRKENESVTSKPCGNASQENGQNTK